jgi:hypothetical protein
MIGPNLSGSLYFKGIEPVRSSYKAVLNGIKKYLNVKAALALPRPRKQDRSANIAN